MRNLQQHPLMVNDVSAVLKQKIADVAASGRIGGIDGVALNAALHFIEANSGAFEAYLQAGSPNQPPRVVARYIVHYEVLQEYKVVRRGNIAVTCSPLVPPDEFLANSVAAAAKECSCDSKCVFLTGVFKL